MKICVSVYILVGWIIFYRSRIVAYCVSGTITIAGDAGATLSQSMNTPDGQIQVILRAFENGTQTNVVGTVCSSDYRLLLNRTWSYV